MAVCALNRVVNRLGGLNASGGGAGASFVAGLRPAAWFRYGDGITSAGGLVSAWADQSGNARPLLQATGTNQPTLEADGSITFDGVDNFLQCGAFTLNQPVTYYLLANPVTDTSGDRFFDGGAAGAAVILAQDGAGGISVNAGAAFGGNLFPTGAYAVVAVVVNGASSSIQVNTVAPITGDAGANNPAGFTMGSSRNGTTQFVNARYKEAIVFPAAHNADTISRVIRYLSQVGQLGL